MEKKKRPLTLTACILNIIFTSLTFIVDIYAIIELTSYPYVNANLFIALLVIDILFIVSLFILSIILINKCGKNIVDFKKCAGIGITIFVFSCIIVFSSLIEIFTGNLLKIIMMLVYAMNGTFILIDVCRNNKAYKNLNEPKQETKYTPNVEEEQSNSQQSAQSATNISTSDKLVQDLIEIKKLKDADIINEEDYNRLKNNIINNVKF